jgi:hypothetical protein
MEQIPGIPQSLAETENRFGSNVTINAIFIRHGEKNPKGELTREGMNQAVAKGESLESNDVIKAESAQIARVMNTIQAVLESAPHDKKLNLRENTKLDFMGSANFKREYAQRGDAAGDWFLRFGDKRPDPGTISPQEAAELFASMVIHYEKMAPRLYSGSKIDWVHGTQQTLVESLLQRVMIREVDGEKVTGFKSIDEVGGMLGFAEGVDFKITTDKSGTPSIKVDFRTKEYDVDVQRLNALAKTYDEKQSVTNEAK